MPLPPRVVAPRSTPAVPFIEPDSADQTEGELDVVIDRLMRETDLDPSDNVQRAAFLEMAARLETENEAAVTIDGRTFTAHGNASPSPARVPVDADIYNEQLPDPGL